MKIAAAQINPCVGDVQGNLNKVREKLTAMNLKLRGE